MADNWIMHHGWRRESRIFLQKKRGLEIVSSLGPIFTDQSLASKLNVDINMADFHVVEITFESTNNQSSSCHKLFFKKHLSKENTIFLMNVPPYCNEVRFILKKVLIKYRYYK